MADDRPIAWLVLEAGTPIFTTDGEQVGKVAEVVADRQKDIFSGITFKPGLLDSPVFVPADKVAEMTEDAVKISMSAEAAEKLEPYEG